MFYGELGITPLTIDIKNRTVAFWGRIIENITNDYLMKLSPKLYLAIYELDTKNKLKSEWIKHVKQNLCETGFSGIWYCQSFSIAKWLTKSNWHSEIEQTSNTNLYNYFKTNFNKYFRSLP